MTIRRAQITARDKTKYRDRYIDKYCNIGKVMNLIIIKIQITVTLQRAIKKSLNLLRHY